MTMALSRPMFHVAGPVKERDVAVVSSAQAPSPLTSSIHDRCDLSGPAASSSVTLAAQLGGFGKLEG